MILNDVPITQNVRTTVKKKVVAMFVEERFNLINNKNVSIISAQFLNKEELNKSFSQI